MAATEEATSRLNSVEDRLAKLDAQIADMRKHADDELKRDEQAEQECPARCDGQQAHSG